MGKYKHASVERLYELYQRYNLELEKGLSIMNLMWRAISPNIPDILDSLDRDEDMLDKLKSFLKAIMEEMDRDEIGNKVDR